MDNSSFEKCCHKELNEQAEESTLFALKRLKEMEENKSTSLAVNYV